MAVWGVQFPVCRFKSGCPSTRYWTTYVTGSTSAAAMFGRELDAVLHSAVHPAAPPGETSKSGSSEKFRAAGRS